jgi:hypothetical protein
MFVAYLDPAAGGMLIQTLIAASVAIPFILRTRIARGIERFRGRRAEQREDHQPTE